MPEIDWDQYEIAEVEDTGAEEGTPFEVGVDADGNETITIEVNDEDTGAPQINLANPLALLQSLMGGGAKPKAATKKAAARPPARPPAAGKKKITLVKKKAAPVSTSRIITARPGPKTLINGDPLEGPRPTGVSDLMNFGCEVIASKEFTGSSNAITGNMEVLQEGIVLVWDVDADDGDYDDKYFTGVAVNTKPWTIPTGAKMGMASFSYKRDNPIAPRPCHIRPGDMIPVTGGVDTSDVIRFVMLGLPLDNGFNGFASPLLRWIYDRAMLPALKARMVIGGAI